MVDFGISLLISSMAIWRTLTKSYEVIPIRPTFQTSVLPLIRLLRPLTVREQPCGLQLFHLLSPASSHKGGHNLLIDGFRAASIFRQSHPELYDLFSTIPIPSHASGTGSSSSPSGVHMAPLVAQPVFTHDPATGELVQVRWNGDDRGVVGGKAWEGKMEAWFEAVRVWEGILRSEEAALWTVMETGTAVSTYPLSLLEFHSN